jgi:hypothetical protein
MSRIPEGRSALFVEMEAEVDGLMVPNGVRYAEVPVSDPDLESSRAMEWSCDEDSDDDPLEVVVDVRTLAELLSKAKKWDTFVASGVAGCTCD